MARDKGYFYLVGEFLLALWAGEVVLLLVDGQVGPEAGEAAKLASAFWHKKRQKKSLDSWHLIASTDIYLMLNNSFR